MVYSIEIDEIIWDEKKWKRFCKYAKRKHRWLTFPGEGCVEVGDRTRVSEFDANVIVRGILDEFLDDKFPLKRYVPENISCKELPIVTDVISDTYLFLSLKLAILQADEKISDQLDQYFLDIIMNYHPSFWHFYDFDEELWRFLDIKGISYREIPMGDICKLIKNILNSDEYVSIHLDEFYLNEKESFQKLHLVRENLVYGYDDAQKVFFVYGFGKREQMRSFQVSYDDMLLAFEKGRRFYFSGAGYLKMKWCDPVVKMKIHECEGFQLTETFLLHKIHDFVYPMKPNLQNEEIKIYGSDVYKWIIEELQGKTKGRTVDYRTFHLLYEHKRNVYRCLKKIEQNGSMSQITSEKIASYKIVVNQFNKIRIMYMREAGMEMRKVQRKKIYSVPKVKESFINEVIKSVEKELEILKEITI